MTAKEYLKRYEYADLRAKRFEAEYKLEHELIGSISINYDGMPHGTGITRKTENEALKLAEKAMCRGETRCDTDQTGSVRLHQRH